MTRNALIARIPKAGRAAIARARLGVAHAVAVAGGGGIAEHTGGVVVVRVDARVTAAALRVGVTLGGRSGDPLDQIRSSFSGE